ncbi:hypothetical protein PRZ48_009352 [Zasmidium cellare]|uniref:Uncharacterized protein n=1 Tax=Zasmidium cellare TaxID=395010 RepID=A0ABR0EBI1_ZASCE|nr:hypothetical protein PRZ48_009352 [Zasmidium cellare]
MPTFVAYAAYGGCAILIPFMWCSNPMVRRRAQAYVQANMRMINAMAEYFKFAALLSIHVRCLYNIHKSNPPVLEDEPKYVDISRLTAFKVESLYARVSILEFLGILQKGQSGLVEPGKETTDLGIGQTPQQETNSAFDNPGQAPARPELSDLMQSQQWNLLPPETNTMGPLPPFLDPDQVESLIEPEMTDFMAIDSSFDWLDIDGWDGGLG